MTPSRAVLIFKTEQTEAGHEHKREACPGGSSPCWAACSPPRDTAPVRAPSARTSSSKARAGEPASECTAVDRRGLVYFLARSAGRRHPGPWIIIRPVNAALGWFFGVFNQAVRSPHRRSTAATVAGVLRLSADRVLHLRRAAGPDRLAVRPRPDRVHPPAGQGLPDPQRAAARRRRRGPDPAHRSTASSSVALSTPGVAHTLAVAGRSLILNANAPNLASMYVILKEFERARPRRASTPTASRPSCAVALPARKSAAASGDDLRRAARRGPGDDRRVQARRRGPGRPRRGRAPARHRSGRQPGQPHARAERACSAAPGPARPGSTSTSTAPSASPWGSP